MRLAIVMASMSVALACPARADDSFLYRQIRFGNALTAEHMSACTIDFTITFQDPTAPPRSSYSLSGSFTFSRRNGRVLATVTMSTFGDSRTKLTGIGRLSDVALTAGDMVVALNPPRAGEELSLKPEDTVALRTVLVGDSILRFTLSDPVRSFALPFSLHSELPGGRTDDIAEAGLSTFDDCLGVLDKASP